VPRSRRAASRGLIYNTSPASVPDFEKQGGLVPLTTSPAAPAYVEARPGLAPARTSRPTASTTQLPWKSNPVMIFYNKKEFAKAGISTTSPPLATYSQFLATARKLVSSGRRSTPFTRRRRASSSRPGTTSTRCTRRRAAGKELVQNDKATFDSAAGPGGRRLLAEAVRRAPGRRRKLPTVDPFADGTAAMAIVGPWAIANLQRRRRLGRGAACRPRRATPWTRFRPSATPRTSPCTPRARTAGPPGTSLKVLHERRAGRQSCWP